MKIFLKAYPQTEYTIFLKSVPARDPYRATTMPKTSRAPRSFRAFAQAAIVAPEAATSSMIQSLFPMIFKKSLPFVSVADTWKAFSIFSFRRALSRMDICGAVARVRIRIFRMRGGAISSGRLFWSASARISD